MSFPNILNNFLLAEKDGKNQVAGNRWQVGMKRPLIIAEQDAGEKRCLRFGEDVHDDVLGARLEGIAMRQRGEFFQPKSARRLGYRLYDCTHFSPKDRLFGP